MGKRHNWELHKDEQGNIVAAMVGTGFNYRRLYPYKWNRQLNCWCKLDAVSPSNFYRGVKQGYISLK